MHRLIGLVLTLFLTCGAASANERPNVIVILTDDHGWADLGAQGIKQDLRTPHLDLLAAGGVRAESGYVTAPQCVPSRAGLLSGCYQNRLGVESNASFQEPRGLAAFNASLSIAERLQSAGYATGMAGKWHLGPEREITQHGFEKVFYKHNNGAGFWNMDLRGQDVTAGPQRDGYHLDLIADFASAFIRRHSQQPFFFYLAYRAPHTPLDAPEKYTSRFPGPMPERRRQALAMISAIDDGVGRIMSTLREQQLEERTLIFFMGDNGAPLKVHRVDSPLNGDAGGWDGSLNEPLNGEKGMLSEGGIRVPWLAYWKGRIPGGQTFRHPVISLDVAATAVAVAGLQVKPEELDGVNLIPYFTGEQTGAPHETLYWRWVAQSAVREGKWKLLVAGTRSYLFDLETDREEQHNLIAQHPDIADRLRTKLTTWSAELEPPGVTVQPPPPATVAYFDHYFDKKTIAPATNQKSRQTPASWIVRNATGTARDGSLHIVPEANQKQNAFVAFSGLRVTGPAQAVVRLRVGQAGQVGIAWRLTGQKDFLKEQTVVVDVAAQADVQTLRFDIPTSETVIHLRLLLPAGESAVESLALQSASGAALKTLWQTDF